MGTDKREGQEESSDTQEQREGHQDEDREMQNMGGEEQLLAGAWGSGKARGAHCLTGPPADPAGPPSQGSCSSVQHGSS